MVPGEGLTGGRMWICCALAVLAVQIYTPVTQGFYVPEMYPRAHAPNSTIAVQVKSLTSIATGIPHKYYSLPFCKPPEGIKPASENFGELLMRDRIENSPYQFRTLVPQQSVKVCDSAPLTEADVENFRQKINDKYHFNMLLDDLPVTTALIEVNPGNIVTGFPIGYLFHGVPYVYNHLIFKVLVHEYKDTATLMNMSAGDSAMDVIPATAGRNNSRYLVVGFEVAACSIARAVDEKVAPYFELPRINCRPPPKPQAVKAGERMVYTFDVLWEESPIAWANRWDAYLKMNGAHIHWSSILNSLMISFLAGLVFVILLRSVHRDLAKIEQMNKEEAAQMADKSGWMLVVGDVFRPPPMPGLLCIVVGNGVQITCTAAVTIFIAALGFMSPAACGALLMGMVVLYLLLGIAAGYVAARLWVMLTGLPEGSVSLALKVATFFPGFASVILLVHNAMLWETNSTGAVPFSVFFVLFFLWFVVSVPLTVAGVHYGMNAEKIRFPVRTTRIPRQIPEQRYPTWRLILGCGILPFVTLYIELFFIMSSIWMERVYYVFGFIFIVLVLLILVCSEVAVLFTYLQLTMEDYRWWWRSFLASGSVAFYAMLYAIYYLIAGGLHDMHGTIIYLAYSALMVLAIFLATGAVGFIASAYFVWYLFLQLLYPLCVEESYRRVPT